MSVSMTFRNMEPSNAIKSYAQEKLDRIRKYFPDPIGAHLVFSCNKNHAYVADIQLTLHNGTLLKAAETSQDMHSSIDLVLDKLEQQLRKHKEKLRDHHPEETNKPR